MNSDQHINEIAAKIDIILSENTTLKGKLEYVEGLKSRVDSELLNAREKVKSLENQIKINNIAKGNLEGGNDVKEMRERLNEVIREVDKCIRHLKG